MTSVAAGAAIGVSVTRGHTTTRFRSPPSEVECITTACAVSRRRTAVHVCGRVTPTTVPGVRHQGVTQLKPGLRNRHAAATAITILALDLPAT